MLYLDSGMTIDIVKDFFLNKKKMIYSCNTQDRQILFKDTHF